jgi:hypothetical protein
MHAVRPLGVLLPITPRGTVMFEAVELNCSISKSTFKKLEPQIRTRLLEMQG